MKKPATIFLVRATKNDRSWLVGHRNAGPAVFTSESVARRHAEDTRATGIEYRVIKVVVEESLIGEEMT